ncbi:MAG: hypothetical protein EB127_30480 [Alphaproteobacteria bacterium]|nr:hypothetical protein [Alphaproteobacteria bacterium]
MSRKQNAYNKVRHFWTTYGTRLQSENRQGTFKYDIVERMRHLHQELSSDASSDALIIIHGNILDVLREQKMYIIQFYFCIDEFNDYLCALRLLDVIIRHNMMD